MGYLIAPVGGGRVQVSFVDLLTVGTAFPAHRIEQSVATGSLAALWDRPGARVEAMQRLHRAAGVEQRYLTLPIDRYGVPRSFTDSNDLFVQHATDLAEAAIRDALDRSGICTSELNMLALVTSSGLAVPSIDARLVNRLDLRRDLKRLPLFGLGCVGGAAGLARCAEYVKAFPGDVALLVCVELCSLTFQADDTSAANLVATGLFGDAAACAVVAGESWAGEQRHPRTNILGSRSLLRPNTEEVLGWRIGESGFRVVLGSELPAIACGALRDDVDRFLGHHGLCRDDVGLWLVHPGGPKVLHGIETALALPPEALRYSWRGLRQLGNVSSAAVLCLLRDVEADGVARGTYGLLMGMGPGFSMEMVLLRWT
jgi:alkylresorcinol/alkylpyrone synthase